MSNILITGANGLVGSHLLSLFDPKDHLHLLGRRSEGSGAANVTFHEVDLASDFDTGDLPEQADAIVYLAQSDHFRSFPDKARDMFDVNVAAPLRLLDYARRTGVRSFVYASSGGVYGPSDSPLAEDSPLPPSAGLGFYPSTKYCAEVIAENFARFMNVCVLRIFFSPTAADRTDRCSFRGWWTP